MFRDKKAAGDAISALILFIAVVGVSTGLVIAMKNYALDAQDSFQYQSEVVNNQFKTSLEITNIFYNSSDNATIVYLKNIGETKVVTQDFDVFLNDGFVSNYTVYRADNLSSELSVLLVSDTAAFYIPQYLASGSHKVKLVSGYGGSGDTDYFNN